MKPTIVHQSESNFILNFNLIIMVDINFLIVINSIGMISLSLIIIVINFEHTLVKKNGRDTHDYKEGCIKTKDNDFSDNSDGKQLFKSGKITIQAKEIVRIEDYGPDNVPTTAY